MPGRSAIDLNGFIAPGAEIAFYASGTSILTPVYADAGLTTQLPNPVAANAAGRFPDIYIDDTKVYRARGVSTETGEILFDTDPYYPGDAAEATNQLLAASAQALISASVAEAASGPTYASTAEGLAATADGEGFAVDNGDGTVTIYRNVSGAAVFQRSLATSEALGSPDGASLVGHEDTGANAVPVTQRALNLAQPVFPELYSNGIEGAIKEGMATGRVVYLDGEYELSDGLTIGLTGDLHIRTSNRARVTYVGTSKIYSLFRIILGEFNLRIDGEGIIFDGANKTTTVFRVQNDDDTVNRPNVYLRGIVAKNAFLDADSIGAACMGIDIVGYMGEVDVANCGVDGVSRSAASPTGTCQGFGIYRGGTWTRSAKRITVRDCFARNVLLPSSDLTDADGFIFYQGFEDGVQFVADGLSCHNCQGRGVKGQNGSAVANYRNINVFRNVPSMGAASGSIDVDLQYGQGTIENVEIEYEGADTHANGTQPVVVNHPGTNANGELDRGFGVCVIDGLTIRDRATGIKPLTTIVGLPYAGTDTYERLIAIRNVKMIGGTAKSLMSLLSLGQFANTIIDIENVMVPFAAASSGSGVALLNGNGAKLDVSLRNVRNIGVDTIPAAQNYDGTLGGTSSNYGRFIDNTGNFGIAMSDGGVNPALPNINGGSQIMGGLANPSAALRKSLSGVYKVFTYYIADGTTIELGPYGYAPGTCAFDIVGSQQGAPGRYTMVNGSNAITVVNAAGGVTKSDTGSEPASGVIRIWKSSEKLMCKVVGDSINVTFAVFAG